VTIVLDASAVLAFLRDEPGTDVVVDSLTGEVVCGAANWSEVAQRSLASGHNWGEARVWLRARGLEIEPVTAEDAEWAARRWKRSENLSLADRLCLALGSRLDATVLTADREWAGLAGVRMIC